jgi:phage tail protein X
MPFDIPMNGSADPDEQPYRIGDRVAVRKWGREFSVTVVSVEVNHGINDCTDVVYEGVPDYSATGDTLKFRMHESVFMDCDDSPITCGVPDGIPNAQAISEAEMLKVINEMRPDEENE